MGSRKGNPWTSGRGLITSQGIISFTGPALRWAIALAVAALVVIVAAAQAADVINGSGVVIGAHGEVLTNAHVVAACTQLALRTSSGVSSPAQVIAQDEQNDLAVVRSKNSLSSVAVFRNGLIRAGDVVVALGYPLAGILARGANLTVGNVSALAGLGDDSRYLQISAPVQPGNSGGPLLDASGHLVGIVTSKLDAALVARFTGDIPQNVNFALKAEVARTFLDSKGIAYQTARSDQQLSTADVGDIARPFTVQIECSPSSSQRLADHQTTDAPQPKFSGRVPQEGGSGQAPGMAAQTTAPAMAQRIVLYEEDLNDQYGRRYVGSAIWRTETISPGPGLAPELAVRADVQIPERRMTVMWSLRRNTDKALPASHTIEIMFTLPADFPGGGIANVPGILMKQTEQARGTPLSGLAVKVTDGFFLIGLSPVDTDVLRNMQLLKERSWFDIPIVYTNGDRAILAMEKGPPGDRAFAALLRPSRRR
jgi:S1-C subfamily serine protease